MSKRTKQQCRAPAMKGRRVCKTHGGKSTGPKTQAGRQRCADARTIHGNETRQARIERSLATARLAVLEAVGHQMGFMSGTRTRGPKPTRMSEVYPELQKVAAPNATSRGLNGIRRRQWKLDCYQSGGPSVNPLGGRT
jgi:hypothetical protein